MQQYDYRIHDRYVLQPALDGGHELPQNTVYTLVILTHSASGPSHLAARHQALQNPHPLRYRVVHLAEWYSRWEALQALAGSNPFAVVIQAQLLAQRHRRGDRFELKLNLVRQLRNHGYRREDVVSLLRLIDWMIQLPAGLEDTYARAAEQIQGEHIVAFVTSFERVGQRRGERLGEQRGIEIGRRQSLHETLLEQMQTKFGPLPEDVRQRLEQADTAQLQGGLRRILSARSVAEVFDAET